MKKYSSSNITDKQVISAVHRHKELYNLGYKDIKWGYEILAETLGYPEKVCYAALERVHRKGYIEYGTSLRSGWITDKGQKVLDSEPQKLGIISMRQYFKEYCKINNIPYATGQSGVPKWFKQIIKELFDGYYIYDNRRYYIDITKGGTNNVDLFNHKN